ncbi:hypothetical protein P7H46_06555 [Enterococcus pseudoavium]|uniref:Uncharacterized protein n=1 Tax=Enterococcus pseudoavium TaxID=44007 RepID=A0ABU3FI48_9ENTE|nr:hypothetical protein [Enterococcus pseudoavium]MDT2770504.1 hypothetical protein [Enterococcus pseudoavium]
MNREEAINLLLSFSREIFDLYGEELEANLYERAVGNEFEDEMKKYEEQRDKLYGLIKVVEGE